MFKTGIVLHYVGEYSKAQFKKNYDILKKYHDLKALKVEIDNDISLKNISENLPIGTIICRHLNDVESIDVCFPMFSSHISMPVKANEVIWYFKDTERSTSDTLEDNHPLFAIKNYWLSRKIGAKISEDLNYTHFQRDALVTNLETKDSDKYDKLSNNSAESSNKKAYEKEIENIVKIPDFSNDSLYADMYNEGLLDSSEDVVKKENDVSFYLDAVPRWYSKPYELTLQGSNNSLINLTKTNNTEESFKNKGAVDIVSGRFFLDKYIKEPDSEFHIFENKTIKNKEEDREKTFKIKKNSFPVIENILGSNETLKSQKFYLNTEEIDELVEGSLNIDKDASRIYIAEADNIDNVNYYDNWYIDFQDKLDLDESRKAVSNSEITVAKSYLLNEDIKRNNFSSIPVDDNNLTVPSIFLKSNNIRVVSRKEYENEENSLKLEEGSIRLVKESNDFSRYSHFCMENDGQIMLDGSTIMLGNFKKEVLKQGIANEDALFEDLPTDDDSYVDMHGKGSGLLIGYEENLAEPLVLGDSLVSILKEMIHVNIALSEELKAVSNALAVHFHIGVLPGPHPSGPPADPSQYIATATAQQPLLKTNYEDIQKNLKEILSRFAKTT